MEGSALPVGIGSHQGIPGTGPLKRTPGNKGNLVGSTSHQTGNSQGKRRSFGAGDKGLPRVSERNLVFHERIQSLCIKRSSGGNPVPRSGGRSRTQIAEEDAVARVATNPEPESVTETVLAGVSGSRELLKSNNTVAALAESADTTANMEIEAILLINSR